MSQRIDGGRVVDSSASNSHCSLLDAMLCWMLCWMQRTNETSDERPSRVGVPTALKTAAMGHNYAMCHVYFETRVTN